MFESYFKNQESDEPNIYSTKEFSKVRFLQILGLLNKKINPKTLKFETSFSLNLIFFIHLFSKPLFTFRPFVSYFFPQNEIIQLYIGNAFNYLDDKPKLFLTFGVSVLMLDFQSMIETH